MSVNLVRIRSINKKIIEWNRDLNIVDMFLNYKRREGKNNIWLNIILLGQATNCIPMYCMRRWKSDGLIPYMGLLCDISIIEYINIHAEPCNN